MWGIFLESVVIFKNYMGYHENGYLAGIYLFALIYLWKTEKDTCKRVLFVYVPTILLLCFFCPLFRKAFVAVLDDSETYYRLLWLLQMSIVSAYGMVKLFGKHRRIGLAVLTVAIIACGNYVYDSEHITKAENAYHLPQTAVQVAKALSPDEGQVKAIVPSELVYYIRQYDSNITMPYGREMLISRWDYYNELYEAMEETDQIKTQSFVELTRENLCNYVVLDKERVMEEPLTDYGFELYDTVEDYVIYRDVVLEETILKQ